MRSANWLRIILCGFVAGVVWYVLSGLSMSLLAEEFLAFTESGGPHSRWPGALFFAIDIAMGIWAIWLFSAIAPRYGEGLKASAIAGLAWWIIKSLQSAKWVGLGFAPGNLVVVPLGATLVAILIATGVGAWLYQRVDLPSGD